VFDIKAAEPKAGHWGGPTRLVALVYLRALGRAVFIRPMPRIAVLQVTVIILKHCCPEWDTPGGQA
jgi:hypothetical protein